MGSMRSGYPRGGFRTQNPVTTPKRHGADRTAQDGEYVSREGFQQDVALQRENGACDQENDEEGQKIVSPLIKVLMPSILSRNQVENCTSTAVRRRNTIRGRRRCSCSIVTSKGRGCAADIRNIGISPPLACGAAAALPVNVQGFQSHQSAAPSTGWIKARKWIPSLWPVAAAVRKTSGSSTRGILPGRLTAANAPHQCHRTRDRFHDSGLCCQISVRLPPLCSSRAG